MITLSDAAATVVDSGSFVYGARASAWLGGTLLAESVPITAGTEDCDRSLNVPDRVTLTVPRRHNGIDWTPTSDTSPLAASGQRLKIQLGVGVAGGAVEWFPRGEFLVLSTVPSSDGLALTVTCGGLLTLTQEADFVTPFQPTGTIASTLRKLLEPAVLVNLLDAPDDRAVPAGTINWDSDRMAAVAELLDAWPADLLMHEQGYARIVPSLEDGDAPVKTYLEGAGGTVVAVSGSTSRDGGFNVVVATGYAADGGEVRGLAYVETGPWAYGIGSATPLPVPFGYSSPLLTTNAQCIAAARTVLARKLRAGVKRRYTITGPLDPRLQLADPVWLTTADGTVDELCTVEALRLPYVPGEMSTDVVTVA